MAHQAGIEEILGAAMLGQCSLRMRVELEAEVDLLLLRDLKAGCDGDLLAKVKALEQAPGPGCNRRLKLWAAILRRRIHDGRG